MKSILRKLIVAFALAVVFSPTYPVVAALVKAKAGPDPELSAVQAEYSGIAPSLDQLQ